MTIKTSRKSPLLTVNIKITGHGASESGEPFVRLEIKGGRVLVRVNNLLGIGSRNIEFARLQNHGALLLDSAARQELTRRIEVARREPASFNVATKPGCHGEVFVFPDAIVPAGWSDIEIYLEDDGADLYRRFRCRGTRAGTMQLFALFAGNSRLITGAALACVGPLSPVLIPEHVALQFVGDPGDGKTSGAVAISSIWGGDPDPNHRLGSGTSWKNTDYALEKYAAAYNNMLLFLDEVDSAEGDDPRATANSLLKAIKDISGGKGKGRGNDPEVRTSYTPILSTSNVSVPRMLIIAKRRVDDFSYIDRLFDIPAPAGGHGFFENLHGFSDLAKFRDRLIELACLHYGLAGRAYVWHIAHALRKDRDEFVAFLKERQEQYQRAVADLKAPGRKLPRVHGKFAIIYAAGCAAIRFKIFPFTEAELLEAVMTCERDHIAFIAKELGGAYALDASQSAAATPLSAYQALKAYLNGPVAKKFINLREAGASVPPGHVHASAPGYLGLYRGKKEIWLPYACFERIAGGPAESRALKAELHAKGHIASEGRGQRRSFSVKRDIPGLGRVRVIALRA
jgi:putative DNA primase/helicase